MQISRKLCNAFRAFFYVLRGGELVPRSPKENETVMVAHPDKLGGCTRKELYYGYSEFGTGGVCPSGIEIKAD